MCLIPYIITDNLEKQQMMVDCVEMAASEACGGFLNGGFASKTVFVNSGIFSLKTSAQKKVLKMSPEKEIWKRNEIIFRAGVMLI